MKTKTFGKKLTLNKKTIADLNLGTMKGIHGGEQAPPLYTKQVYCLVTESCYITDCCPTDCTCGSGDPLCACASRPVE